MVEVRQPKIWKDGLKNLISYLACSQIWPKLPVGHRQFGYMTKNCPKNTLIPY
jgi:hypothetical protein